tara:strand:- start:348 stop:656 length:309 start_codon:yes stop_codon:yes gene_type:complete
MTGIDDVKQQKMEELKKRHYQQQADQQMEQQLEAMIRQVLTEKAKARLANIKIVNKEVYFKAVQSILYLFKSGGIRGKINEEQLKELLRKLTEKREIKIKRK